jgi:hypothetical protein
MRPRFLPIEELEFASRVGFLTRKLWDEFFAKGGPRWQNKLWRRLKEDGFFYSHPLMSNLYLPNPKQREVEVRVPFLAKPPNLNQLGHDELVARSYMFLKRRLPNAELRTEAYLKKEFPLRNKGARMNACEKHPDLVVSVDEEKVAIEIELTRKSRSRYRHILRSYRRANYSRILYLISSGSTKDVIESAATEVSFPTDIIKLGFGSVGSWRVDPLATSIHFSRSTELLANILGLQSDPNKTCVE